MNNISKNWLLLLLIPAAAGVYYFAIHEHEETNTEHHVIINEEEQPQLGIETQTQETQQEPASSNQAEELKKVEPKEDQQPDFTFAPDHNKQEEIPEATESKQLDVEKETKSTPQEEKRKTKKRGPSEQRVQEDKEDAKEEQADEEQNETESVPQPQQNNVARSEEASKKPSTSGSKTFALSFPFSRKTLGYKYIGTHYPTKWVLKLNGKEVLNFDSKNKVFHQKARNITLDPSQPLKAHFDWEFLGGKRKGWKEIDYKVNPNADKLVFSFDWKNEPQQLTVSNTTYITDRSSDNKDVKKYQK